MGSRIGDLSQPLLAQSCWSRVGTVAHPERKQLDDPLFMPVGPKALAAFVLVHFETAFLA